MHTGQEGRHRSSTCILNNALLRLSTVDNPRGWWRWWYLKNRPLDLDKIATRKTVSKSIFLRLEEYIRTGCSKFSRSIKKNFQIFSSPFRSRGTIVTPSSSLPRHPGERNEASARGFARRAQAWPAGTRGSPICVRSRVATAEGRPVYAPRGEHGQLIQAAILSAPVLWRTSVAYRACKNTHADVTRPLPLSKFQN